MKQLAMLIISYGDFIDLKFYDSSTNSAYNLLTPEIIEWESNGFTFTIGEILYATCDGLDCTDDSENDVCAQYRL